MRLGAISLEELGGAAGCALITAAGIALAVATSRILRLIDRGFAFKCRDNPSAAARQVGIFRMLGVVLASVGVSLLALKLLGGDY